MAAESSSDFELEIAHVLFMDIVGYSKLHTDQQRELLNELNKIVRETQQFKEAEAASKLIRLPTGDGMALAFFTNPEAPLKCAIEINQAVIGRAQLQLRMGMHSGPVSGVTDVNDRSNVAGIGINLAQRARRTLPSKMFCAQVLRTARPSSRRLKMPSMEQSANLALVYAWTGEADQAIDLIERLLSAPGAIEWPNWPHNMTLADLRLRWEWDPLRTNPRFQKILAGPEPKTIY